MLSVAVRDFSLVEQGPVGDFRRIELDLRLMLAGDSPSQATIVLPSSSPAVRALLTRPLGTEPGMVAPGIVVRRKGHTSPIFSGTVADIEADMVPGGMTSLVVVGDDALMRDEVCYPVPTTDISDSALSRWASGYDTRTGVAETVALAYVSANVGPAAGVVRRRYPWLTVPASAGRGTSHTYAMRLERLSDMLRRILVPEGLAWRCIQGAPGHVALEVWQPQTITGALFGPTSGSTKSLVLRWRMERTNEVMVMFANQLQNRDFTRRGFIPAVGRARTVTTLDQRQTSDLAEGQRAADDQLAGDMQTAGMTLSVIDAPGRQFGIDYGLGDVVTATDGETRITAQINQVQITWESGQAEPTVTPTIGAISAQDDNAQVASIRRALDSIARSN